MYIIDSGCKNVCVRYSRLVPGARKGNTLRYKRGKLRAILMECATNVFNGEISSAISLLLLDRWCYCLSRNCMLSVATGAVGVAELRVVKGKLSRKDD